MPEKSFHELFDEMIERMEGNQRRMSKISVTSLAALDQARSLRAEDACILLEDALEAIALLSDADFSE